MKEGHRPRRGSQSRYHSVCGAVAVLKETVGVGSYPYILKDRLPLAPVTGYGRGDLASCAHLGTHVSASKGHAPRSLAADEGGRGWTTRQSRTDIENRRVIYLARISFACHVLRFTEQGNNTQ